MGGDLSKPDSGPSLTKAELGILVSLPLLICAINPIVLGNRLADVDTWFYFGHFLSLGKFAHIDAFYANNYYQTRLPYTIPGYVIFHLFPLALAKIVFALSVYAVIAGSLFYTLKAHIGQRAAALSIVLMATDIFFIRTAAWNYVDNGILAYQAAAFAALTAAGAGSNRRMLWITASAFFATSMVFIHIGASILIPIMVAYGWLCVRPQKRTSREQMSILAAIIAGVLICQCLYGILNWWIWGGKFFFVLQQLSAGQNELRHMDQWQPPQLLFTYGGWLGVHLAVWLASTIALSLAALRRVKLKPFEILCYASIIVTYALLFLSDNEKLTYFLSRQGLYTSFFFLLTYMAIGCIVSRGQELSFRSLLTICGCFAFSIAIRLWFDGADIPGLPQLPVWASAVGLGILLVAAFIAKSPGWKTSVLCAAAVPTLFLWWKFEPTQDVYKLVTQLEEMSRGDMVRLWADRNDPMYLNVLTSTSASFTERGWWLRGDDFPAPPLDSLTGDRVFVASSRIHSMAEALAVVKTHVDRAIPIGETHLRLSKGELWIGELRIWNRMGLPPQISRKQIEHDGVPASVLTSNVGRLEGAARAAHEGDTPAGTLTAGPAAGLAAGKYEIVVVYGPSAGDQVWDISSRKSKGVRVMVNGAFKPTQRYDARLVIPITLERRIQNFEFHSYFSGKGELTVRSLAIHPLN